MCDETPPPADDDAPADDVPACPPTPPCDAHVPEVRGPRHHPRRRSSDVTPSAAPDDRRAGQRRHQGAPLQAIPAGHNPFVAAATGANAPGGGGVHPHRLDAIVAEMEQRGDAQLHLYLVTGAPGAGKTTAAHDLIGHWCLGGVLLTPSMAAVRLLAPAPSFVASLRVPWWAAQQAAAARVAAAARAEQRWRDTLLATRMRLLMGLHQWPYPRPDQGWALGIVIDDAHGIGRCSFGRLCGGLARVAYQGASVHLVLIGSPALPVRIPPRWARHVRAHQEIAPYDAAALEAIVAGRLTEFDGARGAIERDAYAALHRLSAGRPGVALALCACALERARADGSARIAARHLGEEGQT